MQMWTSTYLHMHMHIQYKLDSEMSEMPHWISPFIWVLFVYAYACVHVLCVYMYVHGYMGEASGVCQVSFLSPQFLAISISANTSDSYDGE